MAITLSENEREYLLRIPANQRERAKGIPGRRWDVKRKVWYWPRTLETYRGLVAEFGEESSGIGLPEFKNLGLWILISLGAWFGTNYVGFEPTMTICLALGLFFAGVRNYWLTAVISIATPIILSQFAWHIFTSELPGFWRT